MRLDTARRDRPGTGGRALRAGFPRGWPLHVLAGGLGTSPCGRRQAVMSPSAWRFSGFSARARPGHWWAGKAGRWRARQALHVGAVRAGDFLTPCLTPDSVEVKDEGKTVPLGSWGEARTLPLRSPEPRSRPRSATPLNRRALHGFSRQTVAPVGAPECVDAVAPHAAEGAVHARDVVTKALCPLVLPVSYAPMYIVNVRPSPC